MNPPPLALVGSHGSPYSRKMRGVLRYRRIPFRWVIRSSPADRDFPPVPVALVPILVIPGEGGESDTAMIDSTFQIRRLEEIQTGRSLIPSDPAVAFVDALIEDFGDEWLTKAMFHYRWSFEADIAKAGTLLPRWGRIDAPEEGLRTFAERISERQIARLHVVGSNATTGPLIEASYRRILHILDELLQQQPFVLGGRPGRGDFGIFGQLSQLALFDPTSAAIALAEAPRVVAWTQVMEDLSGIEVEDGDWTSRDALPATLRALLAEIGRTYAPFLLGNADALERGDSQVECQIDGGKWVQQPFPYQRKCLRWLREGYAELASGDRSAVDSMLADTGCDVLFD